MEALYGSLPGFGSAARNDADAPIAFYDCIYVGTPSDGGSPKSPLASTSNGANKSGGRLGSAKPPGTGSTGDKGECLPPHVGRIGVYRKFAMFRADMFDLDDTTILLPKSQVKRVDSNGKYAVVLVDWTGVPHEFQLPKLSKTLYRTLANEWGFREGTHVNKRGASAVNEHVLDPIKHGPQTKLGELVEDGSVAVMRAKADLDERRRSALRRIAATFKRRYDACVCALSQMRGGVRRVPTLFLSTRAAAAARSAHGGRARQDGRVSVPEDHRRGRGAGDGRGRDVGSVRHRQVGLVGVQNRGGLRNCKPGLVSLF